MNYVTVAPCPVSLIPPSSLPPRLLSPWSRPAKQSRVRASMAAGASPAMPFPYLPPPHRDLMVDLLSIVESRLGADLFPSSVPPDVLSFQNETGGSRGALDIRSGRNGSSVDFILQSWLHCEVPTGALNITTLFAFLNASTDAPHLLMEFIQSSPTSLILIMDLLPRKDLVFHQDYLKEFYEDSHLDEQRKELDKLKQVLPYCSSSLYIRSVLSPTAIAVNIDCREEGQSAMENIMATQISSAAKEMVRIWLGRCGSSTKQLEEADRDYLLKRDNLIKNKTVEIDLAANLPRLFGPEVADRIVGEIQKAFRTQG